MSLSGDPGEEIVPRLEEDNANQDNSNPEEVGEDKEGGEEEEEEIDEEERMAEEMRRREELELERVNDPMFQAPHLQEGIPPVTCNFGKADYWDGRYFKNTETFEWYHDFEQLQSIINRYCARDGRVLMLGCGNSRLSEDMYYDGYEEIDNVDISRVVIDQMTDKYFEIEGLKWRQCDVCDMGAIWEDAEFDCAIDKGCLDCVFCADLALKKVRKYVHEMDRVLKHGGAWIIFSHGRPEDRLEQLENDDSSSIEFLSFECNVHAIPKPLIDIYGVPDLKDPDELYFVYVCIKNPTKSKQKDDKKNRGIAAKQGKKALAKRLRDIRQKQAEFGAFAKTPTRDAFGN
eukprot:CAMPEP_0118668148 /NCGR_PEP_ID=MMETSP0785-20121206/20188_1 /TAXON_ID=91992 /ORGANISM="Bolidomonas pacifica, Strain CCMP 1866" /LENGTH=344 /DNA_ID=CAMNT_0006562695 /DNA_START=74 /DNA_END=1105 /DNA_ORIENTATION=+